MTAGKSPLKGRLCTIYKGSRRAELYLYVDKRDGVENVPQELLDSLGHLSEVMTLHITEDRRLARVQARQVLQAIDGQGYFVQMPPAPERQGGQADG